MALLPRLQRRGSGASRLNHDDVKGMDQMSETVKCADVMTPVHALDAAVQEATFALAKPGSLPKWMEITALGRNMTPIAQVAVAAAYPFIAAAVEAQTREAIAAEIRDEQVEQVDARLHKICAQCTNCQTCVLAQ